MTSIISYNREDWLTLKMLRDIINSNKDTSNKTHKKYTRVYKKYLRTYSKAS